MMLDDSSSSLNTAIISNTNKFNSSKNSNKSNKRRFSDDQIKSLETIFESETKLEPRKKAQLARELGLQPRHIAIWFQNKRARRKSKQLQRDYGLLRSNYNALSSKFESLNKEKQSLLAQLQNLNDLMEKSSEKKELGQCCREEEVSRSSTNRESDNITGRPMKNDEIDNVKLRLSDDDCCIRTYNQEDDHIHGLLRMVEPVDGLGFDKPSTSYHGWDFWP